MRYKRNNEKLINLFKEYKLNENISVDDNEIELFENIEYLILHNKDFKNINKYTSVRSKYTVGKSDYIRKTKGGEVERYQLNYQGSLIFNNEIGIYYKYCPKQLVPGNDMIKQYQTIGIIAFL